MIREYAPIPLIPAAWAMSFLTVVWPGIDTYWIEHMHLFMLFFLGGFAVFSWNEMEGRVMETWRNIIAAGFIFTGIGAAGFYLGSGSVYLFSIAIIYWIVAPAYGFRVTSDESDRFSQEYRYLFLLSSVPLVLLLAGILTGGKALLGVAFLAAGAIQASSILIASYMDR